MKMLTGVLKENDIAEHAGEKQIREDTQNTAQEHRKFQHQADRHSRSFFIPKTRRGSAHVGPRFALKGVPVDNSTQSHKSGESYRTLLRMTIPRLYGIIEGYTKTPALLLTARGTATTYSDRK